MQRKNKEELKYNAKYGLTSKELEQVFWARVQVAQSWKDCVETVERELDLEKLGWRKEKDVILLMHKKFGGEAIKPLDQWDPRYTTMMGAYVAFMEEERRFINLRQDLINGRYFAGNQSRYYSLNCPFIEGGSWRDFDKTVIGLLGTDW